MEIVKMLADLRAEQAALDEAIAVLARMAAAQPGRRGRPPAWLSAAKGGRGSAGADRPKRVMSDETRKKMARAQKKRWAEYHKGKEE